jgi:hypothetical protein
VSELTKSVLTKTVIKRELMRCSSGDGVSASTGSVSELSSGMFSVIEIAYGRDEWGIIWWDRVHSY